MKTVFNQYRNINPLIKQTRPRPSLTRPLLLGIRNFTNVTTGKLNQTNWISSRIITINKSKFQSHIIKFNGSDNLNELISDLVSNNKSIQKSSHPAMLAWRTGSEDGNGNGNGDRPWNITQVANTNVSNLSKRKTGKDSSKLSGNTTASTYIMKNLSNFNQGFHDDGEGGSGQRLIGLIERLRLVNILVVVTRWYGGVPLGSTRFKCISDIAIENLKDIGVLDLKLSNKNWYINYENFINSKQMNK